MTRTMLGFFAADARDTAPRTTMDTSVTRVFIGKEGNAPSFPKLSGKRVSRKRRSVSLQGGLDGGDSAVDARRIDVEVGHEAHGVLPGVDEDPPGIEPGAEVGGQTFRESGRVIKSARGFVEGPPGRATRT